MKKVTLFFMLLCSFFTYSQVFLNEDFNGSKPSWASGWEYNGGMFPFTTCETQSLSSLATKTLTTPAQTSIGTDITISFDHKIVDTANFEPIAPLANWGTVVYSYTSNGTDWTILETIDDSNYTYDGTCQAMSFTIDGSEVPSGNNFQFKVQFTQVTANFLLFYIIDNLNITQASNTVPNCDASLTSDSSNVSIDMPTLTWNNATGSPTGYTIAVGLSAEDDSVVATTDVGSATSFTFSNTLEYATTYYVTITPYNNAGNATDCSVQTFTTEEAPLLGDVCSHPIEIDLGTGNFNQTAVSLNPFSDDYESVPCYEAGYSIAGTDMVYALTTTEDTSLDIAITNVENQKLTLLVLDACIGVADTCIASGTTGSENTDGTFNDINLNNVVLQGGNTYYFVFGSFGTSSTANSQFNLNITTNDCITPAASLSTVADCDNQEFSVTVDVTSIGNATTLTLSDGGTYQDEELSALGQVTFGPYASGTAVTIEITSDLGCSIAPSTIYYCAPVNDECDSALPLTLSTYNTCDNAISGATYGATHSANNACNTDYKDVWYSFTPTTSGYHNISLTNTNEDINQRINIYGGTCGELTDLTDECDFNSNFSIYLTEGNTYYIPVQSEGEDNDITLGKTFELCAYKLPEAIANDECSNAIAIQASDASGSYNVVSATTANAYHSAELTCAASYYEDVWYSFTAENSGTYYFNFDILVGNNTFYTIYNTGDCTSVDTNYVSGLTNCNNGTGEKAIQLVAGSTYLINVHSQQTATYAFYIYPDATLSNVDVNFEGFRYYPNPVKNSLTFESPNMISSVAIYNVVGQKVLAIAGNNTMSTVNMGALPNGIYFAKVNIDGAEKTIKIIKE
ncbi:T9SS type A sorting domain-containing protein [Mangrovimonas sp. TPBH4]|uniref:T9SS type A sorting domain-containing protein n=1 Tax=Mangrovimonas sp. TPBH4 TaxID=1645914 RepID=UPI0006B614C6|nr:T9SS type A sorting domain-containing protein [Mangrovimonas sp. TPBH4]